MKAFFEGFLIFVVASVLWAFPIEWLSRYWIAHRSDALQRARLIMRTDPQVGWRQRAQLASEFEGASIFTDRDGFRHGGGEAKSARPSVLVLGPSSAFGWGVAFEETWAAQLEKRLGQSTLNASQIGYSLVQGRILYETNFERFKDIDTILIAFGVNDIDRFRFFGSDYLSDVEHFRSLADKPHQFESALPGWAFPALLFRATQELRLYSDCGLAAFPRLRVEADEFGHLLREWVGTLQKSGKRVILVNSAREMPFAADQDRAARVDELYRMSLASHQRGECSQSRRLFHEAKLNEPYRVLRDIDQINMILAEVGQEMSVQVADIAHALQQERKGELFVDPIHPSAKGHMIAANIISSAFERAMKRERITP